jgi:transposase InsO family protein
VQFWVTLPNMVEQTRRSVGVYPSKCVCGQLLGRQLLATHDIEVSMSGTGNCYGNAPMESFFSLLKTELVNHDSYKTRHEAKTSLFDYLEIFYNRQRIHTAVSYPTPLACEQQWNEDALPEFQTAP